MGRSREITTERFKEAQERLAEYADYDTGLLVGRLLSDCETEITRLFKVIDGLIDEQEF